ncbi:hypothetical protein GCM10007981_15930 [Thermocladium modestius]|uniref:Uncharacterized protein n=1 Tax=Thermocladium modestius TaxID=62609 RepID=A0A830H052_9CREN|nr:hypothetical protein [Thermocladium modestius]GGP21959.1 hypothetical protein GCM10007981_15930 [Thermocladium modestius]
MNAENNDETSLRLELLRLMSKKASLHEEYVELFEETRRSLLRLVALKSEYEMACKIAGKEPSHDYDEVVESLVHKYLIRKEK